MSKECECCSQPSGVNLTDKMFWLCSVCFSRKDEIKSSDKKTITTTWVCDSALCGSNIGKKTKKILQSVTRQNL